MTPEEHKIIQAYRDAVGRLLTSASNPGRAAAVLSDNTPGSAYDEVVMAGQEVDALLWMMSRPTGVLGVDLAIPASDRTTYSCRHGHFATPCQLCCTVHKNPLAGGDIAQRHPPKMIVESNPGTPPDPRNAHSTADVVDRLRRLRGDMTRAVETLVGDLIEHYQRGGDADLSDAQARARDHYRKHGHGHVVPRDDGTVMRCGGPAHCKVCSLEKTAIGGDQT